MPEPTTPPIKVGIRIGHRSDPKDKTTEWIQYYIYISFILFIYYISQRQSLESEIKSHNYEEIVMKKENGDLLEGTQTNFFVMKNKVLYTPNEGVLEGTVRQLVIDMCKDNSLPLKYEFPNVKDCKSWDGCFICSTSRLLMPIHELYITDDECVKYKYDTDFAKNLLKLVENSAIKK